VGLANRLVGSRGVARGEVVELEEPANPEFVRAGLLLELAQDEEPPAELPPDPDGERDWKRGPRVECEVTETSNLLGVGALVGQVLWLHETVALDHEFYGRVRITRGLTPVGAAYRREAKRTRVRPSYVRLARDLRRAEPAPDPHDSGPFVKARALRPASIAGQSRRPGETFRAAEGLLGIPVFKGLAEVVSRTSARFKEHLAKLGDFDRNPDLKNPRY
jgi:hypothetical protein